MRRRFISVVLNILLGLIAVLISTALVVPKVGRARPDPHFLATKVTLRATYDALEGYRSDTGKYPPSLRDLLVRPDNLKAWKGPYLAGEASAIRDGWGNRLQYEGSGGKVTLQARVWSMGPDALEGTEDDLYE